MIKVKKFTLIEIMVVIAIIAILISFLLPGLGRARKASQLAVCASNQTQVAMGIFMWSDDHESYIPNAYSGANQVDSLVSRGIQNGGYWSNSLGYYNQGDTEYVTLEVLRDPIIPFKEETFHYGQQISHFSFTKAARTYANGFNPKTIHLTDPSSFLYLADAAVKIDGNSANIQAEASLKDVGSGDIFFERDTYDLDAKDGVTFVPLEGETFDFRHNNNTSNLLFADGHVKSYKRNQITRRMFRYKPSGIDIR
jgi:prepilin-type processing-associated H-X9-DG protein/prepilin-type N-terminal cleavage/methylation domain-containing protein